MSSLRSVVFVPHDGEEILINIDVKQMPSSPTLLLKIERFTFKISLVGRFKRCLLFINC
jgi:hypothetical protein